jgi:sortase A
MRVLALACLVLALSQLGAAAWIQLKAGLAQVLIARAWAAPGPARPWPWADTWPVARLQLPGRGVDLFVMAGDSGNALAFGPGHRTGSAQPGSEGVAIIAGHRDTHFAFLEHVRPGEALLLTDGTGHTWHYRVEATRVADTRQGPLLAAGDGLILVTCYPFDAIRPGGPLRFLVVARPA